MYSARNRPRPSTISRSRPSTHSAYMLNAMCSGPMCRNPAVMSRHHSPSATASGTSAHCRNSAASALSSRLRAWTTVQAKTARLSATRVGTTTGRVPVARRGARVGAAAATQSTHW